VGSGGGISLHISTPPPSYTFVLPVLILKKKLRISHRIHLCLTVLLDKKQRLFSCTSPLPGFVAGWRKLNRNSEILLRLQFSSNGSSTAV